MTTLADHLRALGACDPAVEWVTAQPDQRSEALWAACRDGSWLLWVLEAATIDTSELGYVCAERARQSALRALPLTSARDALAACAPITDRATAEAASRAAASAAASAASRAAEAAPTPAAELSAIADLVRERWTVPPREVIEMLGGWR